MPMYAAVTDSPLGPLTVVATETAITALDWGDLRGDRIGNRITDQAIAALEQYFAGVRDALADLPTAPDVTPFRQKVLTAMQRIPAGNVYTYGELGQAAGASPGAVRAVGSACATNPIPIIIPCHRVVASGGPARGSNLGGFSGLGGLDTKRWLLRHEGWQPEMATLL